MSHYEVHHGCLGSPLTQRGRISASVRIWWSVDRPKSELMCPWSQLSLWCQWTQSPTTEPRLIGWVIKAYWMQCELGFFFQLYHKKSRHCSVAWAQSLYVVQENIDTLQLHVCMSAQSGRCMLPMHEGCLNFSWTWTALKRRLMSALRVSPKWAT